MLKKDYMLYWLVWNTIYANKNYLCLLLILLICFMQSIQKIAININFYSICILIKIMAIL